MKCKICKDHMTITDKYYEGNMVPFDEPDEPMYLIVVYKCDNCGYIYEDKILWG